MRWANVLHDDRYEVSEHGHVRRKPYVAQDKLYGNRHLGEKMLKLAKNKDGYLRVKLASGPVFAHVLVLEAFVCRRPEGLHACHNNGIPDDNRLANLRWDTPKNNVHDRRFHGTYQYGSRNPNYGKYKWPLEVRNEIIVSNKTAKELAEKFGMPRKTVLTIRYQHRKLSDGKYHLRVVDIS